MNYDHSAQPGPAEHHVSAELTAESSRQQLSPPACFHESALGHEPQRTALGAPKPIHVGEQRSLRGDFNDAQLVS